MSYDLNVYVTRRGDWRELGEIVDAMPGLSVDEAAGTGDGLTVVRGGRGRYCFSVDGPFRVEPEDVPESVTAVVLGVSHLFTVMVEGSAGTDVPYALRFARRLVRVFGGVVVDEQNGEVVGRDGTRVVARPARQERISVVTLYWHVPGGAVPSDAAARYLALCRRYLPEALPRRFGEYEPFQGSLSEAGDLGFTEAWHAARGLFFAASDPCLGGAMWDPDAGRAWMMHVDIRREPLTAAPWREALRRLFIGLADQLGCVFASAEVTRDHLWSGRGSTWVDNRTEWLICPVRARRWMGLPPYPAWWSYFGGSYPDLVAPHLPTSEPTPAGGLFHAWTDEPTDRDRLTSLASPKRLLRHRTTHLPADLLATLAPGDPRVRPIPIDRARFIPPELS